MIEVVVLLASVTTTSGLKMNKQLKKIKLEYKTKTNLVNVLCVKLDPISKLTVLATFNVYITEK